MLKHEQQTTRPEKCSTFFGGNNFSGLNLYKAAMVWTGINIKDAGDAGNPGVPSR